MSWLSSIPLVGSYFASTPAANVPAANAAAAPAEPAIVPNLRNNNRRNNVAGASAGAASGNAAGAAAGNTGGATAYGNGNNGQPPSAPVPEAPGESYMKYRQREDKVKAARRKRVARELAAAEEKTKGAVHENYGYLNRVDQRIKDSYAGIYQKNKAKRNRIEREDALAALDAEHAKHMGGSRKTKRSNKKRDNKSRKNKRTNKNRK